VGIQIFQSAGPRLIAANENTLLSDGTNSTFRFLLLKLYCRISMLKICFDFRVMFKEPVEIQPDVNYTASATLKVRVKNFMPDI